MPQDEAARVGALTFAVGKAEVTGMSTYRVRPALPGGHRRVVVEDVEVDVRIKRVKRLSLTVTAPDGRVRASVPLGVPEGIVREVIAGRLDWIRGHRDRIQRMSAESRMGLVSGDRIAVWGEDLELEVVERPGRSTIVQRHNDLVLSVAPGSDADARRRAMERWRRADMTGVAGELIDAWSGALGRAPAAWRIRRMTTRWGSCNPDRRTVTLNLELHHRPPRALEYVVVHELAHLFERGHGPRFVAIMDSHLPGWRVRRAELNGRA